MERTFAITSASSTPFIVISTIGIILILLLGFFVFVGYSARNTKFELTDRGLQIRGAVYGRFIPREEIDQGQIKIIDLKATPEYQPRIRTNGIGLPGYAAGWFRLRNKEKALLFVTDRTNVVYIPTRQGYSVLLSVSPAEDFRQATELWK